ncbi:MAG: polysaccharide biosynthesis protein, partial [Lachnospiraceae bacterium]|nr:polysaccharide biosynthesis protein [Lachnospiraceae bacterium]
MEKGMRTRKRFKVEHWQIIAVCLFVYDILMVNVSYFGALWLRFDLSFSKIEPQYMLGFRRFAPYYTVFCLIVFLILGLYRFIWRFASYNELMKVALASIITTAFQIIGITVMFQRMPISYYLFGAVLQGGFLLASRFGFRFLLFFRNRLARRTGNAIPCMLIGAGEAGQMIIREVTSSGELDEKIACIIDDNPNKWNRYIGSARVVGGRESILESIERYSIQKIYVALPTASAEDRRDILNICKESDCEIKTLPGLYQLANGEASLKEMRDVAIEDLLGRAPVKLDLEVVRDFVKGKTVIVTGGGGSIGSELCRQIAGYGVGRLIIFDIYENNAYDIQNELKKKYPELDLVVLIGSVRDSERLRDVFEKYKPDVVYHAAAHKHVPLMEDSPCETIKNNVLGTYKTAYAAMKSGCERFVLISTDKAVNPTNIMGASKRLCEMVIQTFDYYVSNGRADEIPELTSHSGDADSCAKIGEFVNSVHDKPAGKEHTSGRTRYVAVRFGNVLGSNGSVVPLFRKQIAAGGPVTVTDPNIIRYFMTIPEAVSLVLEAGVMAKGAEIFVLDMGSPVKIDLLARNLIRLSGFKPDVDIKIEYVGLRPGEKLYEEKLMAEEGLEDTANKLIHIGKPIK